MNNKTMKILIVLGVFVAFSFAHASNALAYASFRSNPQAVDYEVVNSDYYYVGNVKYYRTSHNTSNPKPNTTIVNNYYTTAPANTSRVATTTNTSNTSTTKNNTTNTNTTKSTSNDTNTDKNTTDSTTKNTDGVYGGATDVTGGDLTALSLRGSGSFMPSSIWQWILVIFLILTVIILVRIVSKPPRPKIQEVHV